MLEKDKTTKKWRARIFFKGRQITMQTFEFKKDAAKWEADQKLALASNEWHDARAGDITLAAVIREFNEARTGTVSDKTLDTDEANLRLHIPEKMRRMPIRAVQTAELKSLYTALLRKRAHSTVKRIRDSTMSLFNYAVDMAYIPHNPVKDVPVPRGDGRSDKTVRPFTKDEYEDMLAAQRERSPRYADYVEFLRETGLRWGELVALRVGDVVHEPFDAIIVRRSQSDGYAEKQTKSGRVRRVPLLGNAAEIAARYAQGRKRTERLFTSPTGAQLNGGNFKRALDWAATAHGHREYDLRHYAATSWLRDNVDIKTVSAWLGHATTQLTLDTYSHYMGSDADGAAIERVRRARATAGA
ncbi:tyrosine-type recombinase/integrase [Frigoribacterium sp. SL97]|uniref:tyrosine-type recombinase/integrase n=1 Tax=Frigoribacterium sp. SL97 TaxID=2994664 RepID=UPI0022715F0C|nr:site-specific integrase [Frigoribacterium sp. SL97]WAC50573.1 site-specific integrase [Frigoribacterium sp. SL97]